MLQLILRRALSMKFASLREREPFDCSILSFTCELYIMELISHLLKSTFNRFRYTLQAFPACHRVGYHVNMFCIPARQQLILTHSHIPNAAVYQPIYLPSRHKKALSRFCKSIYYSVLSVYLPSKWHCPF